MGFSSQPLPLFPSCGVFLFFLFIYSSVLLSLSFPFPFVSLSFISSVSSARFHSSVLSFCSFSTSFCTFSWLSVSSMFFFLRIYSYVSSLSPSSVPSTMSLLLVFFLPILIITIHSFLVFVLLKFSLLSTSSSSSSYLFLTVRSSFFLTLSHILFHLYLYLSTVLLRLPLKYGIYLAFFLLGVSVSLVIYTAMDIKVDEDVCFHFVYMVFRGKSESIYSTLFPDCSFRLCKLSFRRLETLSEN